MSKVKVITDSTAYLPENVLQKYSIDVIPLHVIWGDEAYRDGVNISPEEFYNKLPKSKVMPTTSQPSPKEFIEFYQKYMDAGYDILSIHISSKLSGTVDSAAQAKSMLKASNIETVDSLFTTVATGFQVVAAAQAAAQGASLMECKKIAENIRGNTQIFFVVNTLEFLRRGGRIGGASAFLGTALDIKPILYVKNGKIEAFEKVRTMKKAIVRMVDIFEGYIGKKNTLYVGFAQANAKENVEILKNEVFNRVNQDKFTEIIESDLSPVIGVHVGPGTVSLGFAALD
jgi:DegV family protein with EDD domain